MKKRMATLLCTAALFLCLALPPAAGAPATVYLLAVNDKMCDLPGAALPVSVGGSIYVPHTVFDKNAAGVDLGVSYSLLRQEGGPILTLYSPYGKLIFTINMGICEDDSGTPMSFRAVIRNGIPYVPVSAVCQFFGLTYSLLPTTDRGTLVRITNGRASLSDSLFLNYATQSMTYRYNQILQNLEVQPSSPAATPTPSPAETGRQDVEVYLAVDASQADNSLPALLPPGVHLLFLFSPDTLAAQSSLVRQAVAGGHSIGFLVEGAPEEALEQLRQGNDLLTHIARTRTHIAAAPSSLIPALTGAGWSCWQSNVTGSSAGAILSALEGKQIGRVTLSPTMAAQALPRLKNAGYTLRQPLETAL